MLRLDSILAVSLVAVVACRSDGREPTSPAPSPTPTASAPPKAPDIGAMPMRPITNPAPTDLDKYKRERSADPAFRLVELGTSKYRGRVSDTCPAGSSVMRPEEGWTLSGGALEIRLPGGGCPTWAGYTVVAKNPADLSEPARERLPAQTLPFYVCADRWHDLCEAHLENTWVFDLAPLVEASKATAAIFAPPTPVDPDPAALCCCSVNNALDVAAWPTCEARGGVCDVEAECYGINEPIPD